MLQKTKAFFTRLGKKALETAKKNIPATISVVLTITAVITTFVLSAQSVNIFDGEKNYSVRGSSENIESIVAGLDLKNEKYEIVSVNKGIFATWVDLEYLFPLTVKVGDTKTVYDVRRGKLGDVLKHAGIVVEEHDTLSLSLDTYISEPTTVEMTDVTYAVETVTKTIPYNSDIVFSDKNDTNTKFTTTGKTGTKTVTCSVKYVNGVKTESTVIDEEITEYAIDSTTVYGTQAPKNTASGIIPASKVASLSKLKAPSDLYINQKGVPVKYSSKKTLRATAYTHTGNACSTGVMPKPGYVAVDPKEIPYGTKMYIVSADGKYVYGYAIAADTGGFIYGSRTDMDLFMNSEAECVKFGRRDITVYFLED